MKGTKQKKFKGVKRKLMHGQYINQKQQYFISVYLFQMLFLYLRLQVVIPSEC